VTLLYDGALEKFADADALRAVLSSPGTRADDVLEWAAWLALRARRATERLQGMPHAAASVVHQDVVAGVDEGVQTLLGGLDTWRVEAPKRAERDVRWTLLLLLRWACLAERAADPHTPVDALDEELAALTRDGGYGGPPRSDRSLGVVSTLFLAATMFLGAKLGCGAQVLAFVSYFVVPTWLLDQVTRTPWLARAPRLLARLHRDEAPDGLNAVRLPEKPSRWGHSLAKLAGFADRRVDTSGAHLERRLTRLLARPVADASALHAWGSHLAHRARAQAEDLERRRRAASSPVHQAILAGVRDDVGPLLERLTRWGPKPREQDAARWTLSLLLRWAWLVERASDENSMRDADALARELALLRRDGARSPTERLRLPTRLLGAMGGAAGVAAFSLVTFPGLWWGAAALAAALGAWGWTWAGGILNWSLRRRTLAEARELLASLAPRALAEEASERRVEEARGSTPVRTMGSGT
jgi:hypothetical protein